MKKLKIIICLLTVVIIILIAGLMCIKKTSNKGDDVLNKDKITIEKPEVEEDDVSITDFMKIEKCVQSYLDYCNINNSSYYTIDNSGNKIRSVEDDDVKRIIYNLLSENYINNNNITLNNLYKFIDNIEEKQIYNVLDIKKVKNQDSNQYIIYGFLQNIENKFVGYKYIIVNLDEANNCFSIEPINKKYDNIKEINVENVKIEKNVNNHMPKVKVTSESMANEYFQLLKRIMLSNPEEAYKILDKEYREKRFKNSENFKKYIKENKEDILKMTLSKYLVNVKDDYKEYICQDRYKNTYTFNVTSVIDYSVKLDTYTIETEEFTKKYNESDEKSKVIMNADIIIKMINARDYIAIYNLLDDNFKNNKFGSEEKFDNYMRNIYSSYYYIVNTEYKDNGKLHILNLKLKDMKNYTDKNFNIIIKLKEKNNFVMSFEVEE